MAKPVTLSSFQAMQRGESDASGDREIGTQDVASVDPLTGSVVDADARLPGFRTPPLTIAEQLRGLVLEDDIAGMPLGQVVGLVRLAVAKAHVNATESEIRDEAERRRSELAEDRADGAGLVFDVDETGSVSNVREPEMTPDRGPDVGTTVHTVTDEEPRFSGGGAEDGATSAKIPTDANFGGKAYREAPELANIAEELIGKHGFLEDLEHCDIRWYWKRKTGVSKGRVKIGFMKRASDLLGHFTGADFIGWLSATTARNAGFTDQQVEAAVFHQLLHIGSDDKGNWIFVPHDFEGFGAEVRHYGTWTEGLKLGGQSFVAAHQMGLFDATDEDEDLDDDDDEDVASGAAYYVGDDLADPDQPYDDEEPDTSGELPTVEEIALSIGKCPHGHEGCNGRHDLADDPLTDTPFA